MTGKLIVLEGTDGSGKRTQTGMLVKRLMSNTIKCWRTSFPRYETPTGRIVGQCYLGKENPEWSGNKGWFGDANTVDPHVASLYYAADRLYALPWIRGMQKDAHLILDRYVESNMALQGGKLEGAERREMIDFIDKIEYGLLQLPRPDSVVFLYMPRAVAQELRKGRGAEDSHEVNPEHLRRAEETYLELADRFHWKKIDCAPDGTIESLRTKENIHEEVYSVVRPILG